MQVQDLMSQEVLTIGVSDSCLEAVRLMYQGRVRHLPVVNRDGLLVGIVTDRDLRHHLFSPRVFDELGTTGVESLLRGVSIAEVMSRAVISVKPLEEVKDAARLMCEQGIGSLPVVEGDRVVGILTETDLLRQICRADVDSSPACADIIISYP